MKRIEKIKHLIEEKYANSSFTANEIAKDLNIQRCDASSDLNKLIKEKYLTKNNSRPVSYKHINVQKEESMFIKEIINESETTLDHLLDVSPSMKNCFQLAKTAVSYPPHGLNTLITGSTGVGKSFLAEIMWEYCRNKGTFELKENTPFVSFNCAEYADNPQLLLSRLFGYVKGSFTGAESDTNGLIQSADGGIIFLDEIHRLPPVGQEMLFSIIDHSKYRRMGENKEHEINVMIICATTAKPDDALLNTYVRRFPVIINIPNLSERTLKERLQLIADFFTNEAISINLPVFVMGNCLKMLMTYEAKKGNIGEIKNMINLACAKSYLRYMTDKNNLDIKPNNKMLTITPYDFPSCLHNGLSNSSILNDFTNLQTFKDGLMVYPFKNRKYTNRLLDDKYEFDLYSYVQNKLENYQSLNLPSFDINTKVSNDLDIYYENIISKLENKEDENTKILFGIIAPLYINVAKCILQTAEKQFNYKYPESIFMAFALHLQEFHSRINEGRTINYPDFDKAIINLEKEMSFLKSIRQEISLKLDSPIPNNELWFWANFLKSANKTNSNKNNIDIIVLCHGENIANEYANLINSMMHKECVYGIDAKLDSNFDTVFNEICEVINSRESEKGILLMADMGSLVNVEKQLIEKTHKYCRVMPIVAAPLLLDVAKRITLSNEPLDVLYDEIFSSYINYIDEMYKKTHNNVQEDLEELFDDNIEKYIITICSSGHGSAVVIKKILEEKLLDCKRLKIINVGIVDDVTHIAKVLGEKLKLIIGGLNPSIPNIKFISLEKALTEKGIASIKDILDESNLIENDFDNNSMNEDILPLIRTVLPNIAPHLDPNTLYDSVWLFYQRIIEIIGNGKERGFYVNLILHYIGMIERIKRNDIWKLPSFGKRIISSKKEIYIKLKSILLETTNSLGITDISDAELSYFLIML